MTDCMSQSLSSFLIHTKEKQHLLVKKLCLDDCDISDFQVAQILTGVKAQAPALKELYYSNCKIGPSGSQAICQLLPHLNELHLNNLQVLDGRKIF